VLAEFTDGEIADLSNWSPIDSPGTADRTYVRFQDGPLGTENVPAIGWLANGAGMSIPNRATGFLTCTSATANVSVSAALPVASPQMVAPARPAVGAPPWSTRVALTPLIMASTFQTMASRRNVLILPEGFDASGKTEFEMLAREAVNNLITDKLTRPYDLLKDSFNFFTAWVESPDSDISVLNELQFVLGPAGVAGQREGKEHGTQSSPLIKNRFLANERNTAFHIAIGGRPAADFSGEQHYPGFHDLRLHPNDFDAFLRGLSQKPTDPGHDPEGKVWARGGKDEALIVFFCRSVREGAANVRRSEKARAVLMTLEERTTHQVAQNVEGNGFDLLVSAVQPARARMSCWLTLAHELAHSFRLEDEYGGKVGDVLPEDRRFVDASANTQRHETLLVSGTLDADKTKWNWPRIKKAAVYVSLSPASPQPQPPRFLCKLERQRDKFNKGDIVHLRSRDLLNSPVFSHSLKVAKVTGNLLELELLPTSDPPAQALMQAPFGIIFVKQGPRANPNLIIHFEAISQINTTGNPTNASHTDSANRACTPGSKAFPTPATNYPQGKTPNPPKFRSWIVGLYESGRSYDCGVYHPTGVCIMRTLRHRGGSTVYQFCHVCRYAMVDLIDPTQHGAIDADYEPRYPR
jgi:hypothetical protein